MTVTPFNKKPSKDQFVQQGLVVFLNSDEEETFPMTTTGEVRNGEIFCRWHDNVGCLQGEWFHPAELYLQGTEEVVDFEPEFDAKENDGADK